VTDEPMDYRDYLIRQQQQQERIAQRFDALFTKDEDHAAAATQRIEDQAYYDAQEAAAYDDVQESLTDVITQTRDLHAQIQSGIAPEKGCAGTACRPGKAARQAGRQDRPDQEEARPLGTGTALPGLVAAKLLIDHPVRFRSIAICAYDEGGWMSPSVIVSCVKLSPRSQPTLATHRWPCGRLRCGHGRRRRGVGLCAHAWRGRSAPLPVHGRGCPAERAGPLAGGGHHPRCNGGRYRLRPRRIVPRRHGRYRARRPAHRS
jgi:hypothetical protein